MHRIAYIAPPDRRVSLCAPGRTAQLPGRLRELGVQAVVDANPAGKAVSLAEGDLLLLDPMTTHSGSAQR